MSYYNRKTHDFKRGNDESCVKCHIDFANSEGTSCKQQQAINKVFMDTDYIETRTHFLLFSITINLPANLRELAIEKLVPIERLAKELKAILNESFNQ